MNKDNEISGRPYERFKAFGPENMTDSELLAVILRTGTDSADATELAEQVLALGKYPRVGLLGLHDVSLEDLMGIKGIGEVKAVKLKVISELSRRLSRMEAKEGLCFTRPETVAQYYMETLRHRRTECFILMCMDSKGMLVSEKKMSEGSVNMALISPREIFLEALSCNAVSIIMVHNHPSGNPEPSSQDVKITGNVRVIGNMMGIELLDHVIVGDNKFFSFRQERMFN